MRTSHYSVLLALSLFGVGSLVSGPARADNLLIQNQLSKWKLGSSPAANPLPVEVRKGDVIEFKVTGPHGIVTIDKPGDQMPAPALDLVLSCGEDPGSKPNAVLRELECGAASKFNKVLTSPMKLEVTEKFQGDIHFWCIVHKQGMWGTLKLKTKTAAEPRFVRQSLAEFVKDPQKLATLIRGINEMKRRSAAPPASAEYRTSWEYWANMHGYPGPNAPTGTVEQVRRAREARFPEDAPLYAGFYAGLRDFTPPDALAQEVWATCPHSRQGAPALHFLSWHRMYLFFFERVLREASGDSEFALPYWDYTNNKPADPADRPWAVPSVFAQETLTTTGGEIPNPLYERRRTAGFADSVQIDINNATTNVDSTLDLDDFFDFQFTLETTIHGHIHCTVGNGCLAPYIGIVPFAGNDLLFWMHHANIDRLWSCWTNSHGEKSNPVSDENWMKTPFVFVDEKGARVEMKVSELFDPNGRIDYRYANVLQCYRGEPKAEPVRPQVVAGRAKPLLAGSNKSSVDIASAERVVVSAMNQEIALQPRTDKAGNDARLFAARPNSLRPSKVTLRLENVELKKDPGVSIAVLLVDSKSKQRAFVGVISFFGAFDHDPAHAHDGKASLDRVTFDVTSQFQKLQSSVDAGDIHLALEATSGLSGNVRAPNEARLRASEVTIGRVRLEAQTSTILLDLK